MEPQLTRLEYPETSLSLIANAEVVKGFGKPETFGFNNLKNPFHVVSCMRPPTTPRDLTLLRAASLI
jgi:hypothetical protein